MAFICEDFPACGHELNDCDGSLYGSDEAIKAEARTHFQCEHEHGFCVLDEDDEDLDDEDLDEDHELDDDPPNGIDDGVMTGADYYAYLLAQEGPRE